MDSSKVDPIPMVLHCPECRTRHIDEGEFAVKPHHTHSCQGCGLTWRPAVVATVGVQYLPGFKNLPETSLTPEEESLIASKLSSVTNFRTIQEGLLWQDAMKLLQALRETRAHIKSTQNLESALAEARSDGDSARGVLREVWLILREVAPRAIGIREGARDVVTEIQRLREKAS